MTDDTTNPSPRQQVLEAFGDLTKLPDIKRLLQRGRDPDTARFTLELQDGRNITIGNAETLFSRTRFTRLTAVTLGQVLPPIKPSDWHDAIGALIAHATDVHETPDEELAARLTDWLEQYLRGAATSDRDNAAAAREPFLDNGHVYVHAEHLATWITSRYRERIKASDLRAALSDNDYQPQRVDYTISRRGNQRTRSTARYYRTPHKYDNV